MLGRCLALAVLLLASMAAMGQSVNMPTTGSKDTTVSSITVYDDGGPDDNYATRANSRWTFRTSTPGHRFRVKLQSDMFVQPTVANMRIYEGDSVDENRLRYETNNYWETRSRYFYSDSDAVTITFYSDNDDPTNGFSIELCEASGMAPAYVSETYVDSSTVRLSWPEDDTSRHWIIEYVQSNDASGSYNCDISLGDTTYPVTVLYSDTNFIDITNLEQRISYVVHSEVITPCAIGYIGCYCPCVTPRNLQTHYDHDSIRVTWSYDSTVHYWNLRGWAPEYYDVEVTDTVMAFPYGCTGGDWNMYIEGNCHFDIEGYCDYGYASMTGAPCKRINDMGYGPVTDTSVSPIWRHSYWENDTVLGFEVSYREASMPEDSNRVWDTVYFDEMADSIWGVPVYSYEWVWCDTIEGLKPHTNYYVTITALCDDSTRSCGSLRSYTTSLENCIDYINVRDLERVHLTVGPYENPYESDGQAYYNRYGFYDYNRPDWGNYWFNSDYFVPYTYVNETDWRTYNYINGKVLRCVPEGDVASLRLGNPSPGEAETVTFDYDVDTTAYDLLVLKYALVMQNPDHTLENQPHFTMEILDSTGALIDSTCCYADFFAADNLVGWDSVPESNIIWKDWTTVGIDLAPYQGQRIKVRLINKDCAEGGHYAYAYFTMHCDNKRIVLINRCDAEDSIHLVAPLGFDYQWFRSDNPSVILDTTYDFLAPIDSLSYTVRCSFVGKPTCNFEISTVTIDVFPVAQLHYWVDTCKQLAYLVSDTYLEYDTSFQAYTEQMIDTFYWQFDDGSIHYGDTVTIPLTENRTYVPWLHAQLSNSLCRSHATDSIEVNFAYEKAILGDTVICESDSLTLTAHFYPDNPHTFRWLQGGSADSTESWLPTLADTVYSVELQYNNCLDTLHHRLTIHPITYDTIRGTTCDGYYYTQSGFNEVVAGTYDSLRVNSHGCDSIATLILTVNDNSDSTLTLSVCDEYQLKSFTFTQSIDTVVVDTNAVGCDSVITLHLNVRYSNIYRDTATACDTYAWHGYTFNASKDTTLNFLNSIGCDSSYSLHLTINPSYHIYDSLTVCDSGAWRGYTYYADKDTTLNRTSVANCDSVMNLHLVVNHRNDSVYNVVECDEYLWQGHTFTATADSTVLFANRYSCDSTLTLHLTVNYSYETGDTTIVCPYQHFTYGSVTFGNPIDFDTLYTAANGCDSLVHVSLQRRDTNFHLVLSLSDDGVAWFPLDTTLLGCAPYTFHLKDSTQGIVSRKWWLASTDTVILDSMQSVSVEVDTGYYDLVYTSLDDVNCRDTVSLKNIAVVFPRPTAAFTWVDTIPSNIHPEVTFINRSEPADIITYLWNIQGLGGTDTSTQVNPGYSWGEIGDATEGTYDVLLTAYWEHWYDTVRNIVCIDTESHSVEVTNVYLQFPNLVTPNGDGQNDYWEVVNLTEIGNYPMNEVWIYDRWGTLVWHRENMKGDADRWDPNETRSPEGTYYFRFTARGLYGVVKRNGVIEVLRKDR